MRLSGLILCLLFVFSGTNAQKAFSTDIEIKTGVVFVVENIYYSSTNWYMDPQSKSALDTLVLFLNRNEKLQIEISNHFPPEPKYEYSLTLCYKRAQSVVDYLIENGIDADRLVPRGYGKTTPYVVPQKTKYFKKGTVLTEEFIASLRDESVRAEANRLNTRTQIKILRTDFTLKPTPKN